MVFDSSMQVFYGFAKWTMVFSWWTCIVCRLSSDAVCNDGYVMDYAVMVMVWKWNMLFCLA